MQPALISTMLLQVYFKGPASPDQIWTWSIYDWNSGKWIKLGDTLGIGGGQWKTLAFPIRNVRRYVSPGREIRIQLRSNNSNGDAMIDYGALHVTYRPFINGPGNVAPTTPSRRAGIASARTPSRPVNASIRTPSP
jgi:hypothetical protein